MINAETKGNLLSIYLNSVLTRRKTQNDLCKNCLRVNLSIALPKTKLKKNTSIKYI